MSSFFFDCERSNSSSVFNTDAKLSGGLGFRRGFALVNWGGASTFGFGSGLAFGFGGGFFFAFAFGGGGGAKAAVSWEGVGGGGGGGGVLDFGGAGGFIRLASAFFFDFGFRGGGGGALVFSAMVTNSTIIGVSTRGNGSLNAGSPI